MYQSHRLRILQELALRGTLAAVAEALSYSPSTISHQLTQLEKEVGVRLLEPDGRRVKLTAHGEALAAHAQRMRDLEEELEQQLRFNQPDRATVRICVLQSVAQTLLPHVLSRLPDMSPAVRLEIKELTPEEGLLELVARGLDLVIAEQYPGHTREHRKGTRRRTLGMDRMRIALPAGDKAGTLADLHDRAWVFLPPSMHAHQWCIERCRASGFEPDVQFEVADLATHIQLISARHAVGILPDLLWAAGNHSVSLLDLPGTPEREIFIASRNSSISNRSIAAVCRLFEEVFIEHAQDASQAQKLLICDETSFTVP